MSCSNQKEVIGAKWAGDSDFMFVTENKMKMHYATQVSGKIAFVGGIYEVLKSNTTEVLEKLEVTQIEFETRSDGLKYCRLWGQVSNSKEESYDFELSKEAILKNKLILKVFSLMITIDKV